jgi:large subunit ribosomal protein L21
LPPDDPPASENRLTGEPRFVYCRVFAAEALSAAHFVLPVRPPRFKPKVARRVGFGVMYAVIRTGGKQYKVAANDVITVEKLPGEAGAVVQFDEVLMVGGADKSTVGAPLVAGACVTATVLDQVKADKIIVFKKKRRHNYRRKKGHRQFGTVLRIAGIWTEGQKPEMPAAAQSAAAKKSAAPRKKAAAKKTAAAKK